MWMTWALLPCLFLSEANASDTRQVRRDDSTAPAMADTGGSGDEDGAKSEDEPSSGGSDGEESDADDGPDEPEWVEVSEQMKSAKARNRLPSNRVFGVVTGTIGAGLLVAGGVLRSRLRDDVTSYTGPADGYWPKDIETLRLQTNVLLISGWVGLGAGATFGLMPLPDKSEPVFALSAGWSTRW